MNDCWNSNTWDSTKLIDLVGIDKTKEIIHLNIQLKPGVDNCLGAKLFRGFHNKVGLGLSARERCCIRGV